MTRKTTRVFASILSPLTGLLLPLVGLADDVKWRTDYNAARKEAVEKNRPLILDFGTESCFWCKKLDATTFQEPVVLGLLNEKFIPLKVDAEQNRPLAEALRIQSFPTLVLAGPDGKIVGTLEGYLDAGRLQEQLNRVLADLNNPEWMQRDYQEAGKAIASADYARAIALLKSVNEDGRDRPVQTKARQLLQDLEQQAAGKLARAKQLEEHGQTSDAINTVSELLRVYAGTRAAVEGGQLLTNLAARPAVKDELRSNQARDLLAQAREDYRTRQFMGCLDRCELLRGAYGDLPEGKEAVQLAAEIKSNPEWLMKACEAATERASSLYLSLAETLIRKGQSQQAALYLERVIQAFPGTHYAETAQVRLSAIQGRPNLQTDFKKP
jgi:thioredoxin-related protein